MTGELMNWALVTPPQAMFIKPENMVMLRPGKSICLDVQSLKSLSNALIEVILDCW